MPIILAQAGIHAMTPVARVLWIPACAGMTNASKLYWLPVDGYYNAKFNALMSLTFSTSDN